MPTILVIEDDSDYRTMISDMLELAGYKVIEAEDGEIGARLYREKKPDVTITDLIMPNKEGIELVMELTAEFPDARIIAISGGGKLPPEIFLEAAKELGAKSFLRKPFKRKELIAAVEECLSC